MTCSTGCDDYFVPICIEPTKDMLYSSLIVCCMFSSRWKYKRLFEKLMIPPVHLPLPSCIHHQWCKQCRYPRHYHLCLRIMRHLPWLYPYYYGDKFQDIDLVDWWESVWYQHWCNASYYEFYHGSKLDEFIETLDPTKIMQVLKQDFILTGVAEKNGRKQCRKLWQALIAVDVLIPEELRGRRTVYFNDKEVYPIVFDSGASISITPVIEDFIGPIHPIMTSIRGLMNETKVEGIGHVRWNVKDVFSKVMTIKTDAYLISNAEVRLFSPQVYLQEKKAGEYIMRWDTMTLRTPEGDELTIPYYHGNNLPMAFESPEWVNVTLAFNEVTPDGIFMSVTDEMNQNLMKAQRELLQWHWKLGHLRFQWLQELMRPKNPKSMRHFDDSELLAPVIETKTPTARSCAAPLCAACQLGRMNRIGVGMSIEKKKSEKYMELKKDHLQPGQVISIDQYVSSTRGRLPDTHGKEKQDDKYSGGTLIVDHASGVIFLWHQVSLRAGKTIITKKLFEWWAAQHGVRIEKYHGDNGIFTSKEFAEHLEQKGQQVDFSGTGAHHQNGIAEWGIKTVVQWARTMVLHVAIHWPEWADLELWPFALDYAAYLWNNLPSQDTGLALIKIFSQQKMLSYEHLRWAHVWGCPTYVLDPKLQDGKKLPKWQPRSWWGQFMGVSTSHASTIGLILNTRTGSVTPQYHIVHDDWFATVPNAEGGGAVIETEQDALRVEKVDQSRNWTLYWWRIWWEWRPIAGARIAWWMAYWSWEGSSPTEGAVAHCSEFWWWCRLMRWWYRSSRSRIVRHKWQSRYW